MRSHLPPALQPPAELPLSEKVAWSYADLERGMGLSRPVLRDAVQNMGLPFVQVRGRVLFVPDAVRSWLQSRLTTATAADAPLVDDVADAGDDAK